MIQLINVLKIVVIKYIFINPQIMFVRIQKFAHQQMMQAINT